MEIKRILVVDDEPAMCLALKKNLEMLGTFEVQICTDSTKAIEESKRLQPDLVFLDVIMPGTWGGDVAEQLRRLKETRHIPVVFMTALPANSQEDTEQQKWLSKEKFILEKPFGIAQVVQIIAQVVKLEPEERKPKEGIPEIS